MIHSRCRVCSSSQVRLVTCGEGLDDDDCLLVSKIYHKIGDIQMNMMKMSVYLFYNVKIYQSHCEDETFGHIYIVSYISTDKKCKL